MPLVCSADGVVGLYAVTLEVESDGVSVEQLDYLTLMSNQVENWYREVEERPTVVYSLTDVQNFITEALHRESDLGNPTLGLHDSLQLESGEASDRRVAELVLYEKCVFTLIHAADLTSSLNGRSDRSEPAGVWPDQRADLACSTSCKSHCTGWEPDVFQSTVYTQTHTHIHTHTHTHTHTHLLTHSHLALQYVA